MDIVRAYENAVKKSDDAIAAIDRLRRAIEDIPDVTLDRSEDINDIRVLLCRQRVRLARSLAFERNQAFR